MKIADINAKAKAGTTVVFGMFRGYKAEQTAKAGCNEKYGVLVGDQVHEFTMWAAKGLTLDKIPRPVFADKAGTTVAVLDASIKTDGKYLRCGCSAVVAVEF